MKRKIETKITNSEERKKLDELILMSFRNRCMHYSIYQISREMKIEERTITRIIRGEMKVNDNLLKIISLWVVRDIVRLNQRDVKNFGHER